MFCGSPNVHHLYTVVKQSKHKIMKKQTRRGSSIALTAKELTALKQYRKGYNTEVECALSIGIDRNVLNRITTFGSGSPDKVEKIRSAIADLLEPAAK